MEIYIEYVIIDNLILDCILLYIMQKLMREKATWWKILIGGVFGTVFSVMTPYISLQKELFFLAKILISLLMVSFARLKFKGMFRAIMFFYLSTFTFGGVIIGVFYLLEIDFTSANALYYLLDFPIGIIVGGMLLGIILMIKGYKIAKRLRGNSKYLYDVEMFHMNKSVKAVGFLDSGNFLKDRITGKPILVASVKCLLPLIENVDFSRLDKMKVSSISSQSETIRILEIEKLVIYDGKQLNIHNNILLGLSYRPISRDDKFDLLLNKELFEE